MLSASSTTSVTVSLTNGSGTNRSALSSSSPTSTLPHILPVDHKLVSTLQAHPYDPHYLSGGVDGAIYLWQFKIPAHVAQYRPHNTPYINRIRFSESGTKFAACDNEGNISLWRWSSQDESLRPFLTFDCHGERTADMAFLNHGSFFATCGSGGCGNSTGGNATGNVAGAGNLSFWDSLLPRNKMKVWSNNIETGGTALIYSPRHQVLFCGNKKGDITLIDLRQRQILTTIEKAHDQTVKSLDLDPRASLLISGSSDGSVKVWSLNSSVLSTLAKSPSSYNVEYFYEPSDIQVPMLYKWEDVHKQQTLVRPLLSQVSGGTSFFTPVRTVGVMQVAVSHGALYSCGSDGRIVCKPIL